MAIQRGAAGVVGFGLPANATYATNVPASHILLCDPWGDATQASIYDSRSQASGIEEGFGVIIQQNETTINLSGTVCDLAFPILNALALGVDTLSTIDTTLRQHVCTPVGISSEIPCFSIYLKHTAVSDSSTTGSIRFDGCVIDSLTLSMDVGSVWKWSASIKTNGQGTSFTTDLSSLTKATVPAIQGFRSEFVRSTTQPTAVTADPGTGIGTEANYSGGVGSGWTNTSLSLALRSLSITINNNLQSIYAGGGSQGVATAITRTNRVTTISPTFWFDAVGSTYIRGMPIAMNSAPSDDGFIIRCISGVTASLSYNYGFEYLFPAAWLTSVSMGKDNGARTVTPVYTVSKLGSLETIYAVGWNLNNVDYA